MKPIDLSNRIVQEDIENILSSPLPWERLAGKTILVTGASGMLASYIVFTLVAWIHKHPDANTAMYLAVRNIQKAEKKFQGFLYEDWLHIIEWHGTEDIILDCKVDYIIHAASIADSSFYMTMPVETALPNVIGTWKLLELAKKDRVKGFLFFSSGDVYGKLDVSRPIRECDNGYLLPNAVRSCYGESKRMAENLCVTYHSEYSIPTYCVRIAHTYGPSLDLDNDKRVFTEFIKNILNHEDICMKSDGSACRCFCYITDAIEAFFRILFLGQPGSSYNMCNDTQMESILGLAKRLIAMFPNQDIKIIRQEREKNDPYSENKNANVQPFDTSKLRSLGWEPKVSIENGFYRTILALQ